MSSYLHFEHTSSIVLLLFLYNLIHALLNCGLARRFKNRSFFFALQKQSTVVKPSSADLFWLTDIASGYLRATSACNTQHQVISEHVQYKKKRGAQVDASGNWTLPLAQQTETRGGETKNDLGPISPPIIVCSSSPRIIPIESENGRLEINDLWRSRLLIVRNLYMHLHFY